MAAPGGRSFGAEFPQQPPRPPDDVELKNIIDKLANFVSRNGPEFEQMTMNKQRENPKFQFLFGGEWHGYYRWRIHTEQQQAAAGQGGFPQSLPPDTSGVGELQIPPLIQPLMSVGGFPRIPPNVPPPPFPPAPLFRGGTLPPGFPPGFPLNMPPPPLLPLSGPPPSSSNSKSQPQSLMAGNPPWKSQAPPPSSQAPPTGPSHQLSMVRRELQKEIETYGVIDPMEREFGSVVKGLMESCTKDLISSAKGWIFSHTHQPDGCAKVAKFLLRKTLDDSGVGYKEKLHIIYLINDVVHQCVRKGAQDLLQAIEDLVVQIVYNVYSSTSPEHTEGLVKVVKRWESQKYFTDSVLQQINEVVAGSSAGPLPVREPLAQLTHTHTHTHQSRETDGPEGGRDERKTWSEDQPQAPWEVPQQQQPRPPPWDPPQQPPPDNQPLPPWQQEPPQQVVPPWQQPPQPRPWEKQPDSGNPLPWQQQQRAPPPWPPHPDGPRPPPWAGPPGGPPPLPWQQIQAPPPVGEPTPLFPPTKQGEPPLPPVTSSVPLLSSQESGGREERVEERERPSLDVDRRQELGGEVPVSESQPSDQQLHPPRSESSPVRDPLLSRPLPPHEEDMGPSEEPERRRGPVESFDYQHGRPFGRGYSDERFHDDRPPHPREVFEYNHRPPPHWDLPPPPHHPHMPPMGPGFDSWGPPPPPHLPPPPPHHHHHPPPAPDLPPPIPYYDLPAGLMVAIVPLFEHSYRPLDPRDIRLPPPQPPSERLLLAVEEFYKPASEDKPRNEGWEEGVGLGAREQGIQEPIKGGEVRDKNDKYKGVGMNMQDPFELFRKNKSYTFNRSRGAPPSPP